MQHFSTAILSALLSLFVTADRPNQQVQSDQCHDICAVTQESHSDPKTLHIGKPVMPENPGNNHLPSFLAPIIAATKTYVLLTDNLPTGAGPGDVLRYTVNITNSGDMDANNVLFTDMIDINTTLVPGSLKSSPILRNDAYSTVGNVSISVPSGTGLLSNDTDLDGDVITVTAVNTAGTQGDVTFMADGSFTFNPAPGFTGTTTFTYTATDGLFPRTATVSVTMTGMIWFINASAAAGGDGRLNTPFNTMNAFNTTAMDDPGDNIFVYTGTYSNTSSTTLLASQRLIGQGAVGASLAALTGVTFSVHPPISPATIPAVNGTNPTINQAGNSIVLGNTNQVRGFNINNTGSTALSGSNFGTLTARQLTIANTGGIAINLGTGVLDVIVQSVSASNGTYGIRLGSTTGSFEITGSGTTDGSGGTFSNISLRGIELITATNITLRNLTMNNANTTDAGGDTVCDEDQNLACHAAIYMQNVTGTNLFNNVDINGTVEQGINGNNVANLTLTNCTVNNAGAGGDIEENGLKFINLSGTCSFTGCTFSNSARRNTHIRNDAGNLNLNVQNCSFSNTAYDISRFDCFEMRTLSNSSATVTLNNSTFHRAGSKGIQCLAEGSSTFNLNVTNSSIQRFGNPMAGIEVGSVGSATMNYNVNDNTAIEAQGEVAVLASTLNTSVINGRVNNNTSITHNSPAATIFSNIRILQEGDGASRVEMRNNPSVSSTNLEIPVILLSRLGTNANSRLDLTLDNNDVFDTYAAGLEGIELRVGTSTMGTATNRICGNIINNSVTLTTAPRAFRARIIDPTGFMNLHGTGPVGLAWWTGLGNTAPPVGNIVGSATAPAAITFGNTCNTPAHAAPFAGDVVDALALDETGEIPLQAIYNPEVANDNGSSDVSVTEPEIAFSMMAGETVIVGAPTGFNLPPTKDITIQFDVTVNDPFPLGVCTVSNQGTVSGSNFMDVLTDDTSVVGPANPTVTTLQIAPTITVCQTNIMTNTDPDLCTASESFVAVAVGCPAPTLTYRIGMTVITSPHVFPIGTTTVDVTASNGNLPNATCSFTVTVTDNQIPTITCPGGPFSRGTNLGNCSYTVQGTEFNPSFSDNCPGATLSNDFNGAASLAGAVLPIGSTQILWTVTDANNNTNTCAIIVEVNDDDLPTINCPAPASTPCDINDFPPYANLSAFTSAGGTVNDNCGVDNGSFMYLGETVLVNVYTRTYQISDINGNMASCTQTVTVNDVTPPVITPGTVAACYPTAAALEAAAISTTTAMDNCPGTLAFTASTAGTCTAIVTVTVTDLAGNSSTTTYASRVDNTPPVITTGTINSCYNSVALAEAAALAATSATDNCPGTITYTASTDGTCTAIITVTATDGCGNFSTTTYATVIDDSDPVITVTGTIAACYPTAALAEAAAIAATSATDNCPGSLIYTASTAGDCTAIITVTVTDGCSRSDQTTYSTRIDNTAPVITPGSIATCYPTVAAAESAALAATTAIDNCTGPITYGVSTAGDCSAIVTVTATDGCGNQSSTTYNTRIDNTPPTSVAGSIAACYPTVAAAETAALAATTATDNCPGTLTETASTVGTCAAIITVTTTDGCGNSSSVTYNTIIDNTPPVITPGSIGACYPTVAAAEAAALSATTAVDNCLGTVTFSAGTLGDCSAVVTITATDFCGNSSTTTYNTRIDNTAPTITQGTIASCYPTVAAAEAAALAATSATDNCPGVLDETVSTTGTCDAVITVTTTDECGNSASVMYNTRIDNAGPMVVKGSIASCYPTAAAAEAAAILATSATDDCPSSLVYTAATVGTCSAVVTVTVTDGCGNSASTTYDTRIDNTPPTVTSGSIAACYPTVAAAEAAALAATSATDNCPGILTETASTAGDCSAVITVTTTDGCGNSASVTYNTRIDNTPPVIITGTIASCYPSTLDAETAALAATSATDNCPGTINYTAATAGDCSAVITVTATDGCGNSSTTTYNTRIDNTAPVITTGTIGSCYLTQASAEAAALAATTATDNCPGTITFSVSTSGDCSALITVTATDFCGNSSSTSYNTRIDNTPPVVTAGTIAACYNNVAAAEAAAMAATTATDNCVGILSETASTMGSCEAVITVTVTDECGNSSSVNYNTRVDSIGPTIIPGTIAGCYPTQAAAEAAALAATTAVDDCPSSLTFTVSTTGVCDAQVVVTVTDGCSNSSSHTYFTRIDNTPPVAVCKTGTVFVNISGPYQLLPSDVFDAGASSDNCPGPLTVISITPATVDCDVLDQTIPVQVIVRDSCGYRDTCIAMITVDEDNSIPAPWTNTSIGGAPGGAQAIPCLAEGTFEVSSTGFPTPTADKQNYLHQTICGDGSITVHVSNIIGGGLAGVEFRETLLPGSKRASLKTQLTNILRRQVRLVTNGAMQQVLLNKPNPPSWLRMTRVGNVFTGFTSVNGVDWDFAFTATISMANCITVGMLSESINNSVNNQAWFDNVTVVGTNSIPRPFKGDIPEDMENELLVELYPNPAQQWVMVATPEVSDSKILTVTAFNALGNVLDQQRLSGGHTSLDITNWLPGVYWIKVELDGKSVTKKLIKMH